MKSTTVLLLALLSIVPVVSAATNFDMNEYHGMTAVPETVEGPWNLYHGPNTVDGRIVRDHEAPVSISYWTVFVGGVPPQ